jgi:hypothetical protein
LALGSLAEWTTEEGVRKKVRLLLEPFSGRVIFDHIPKTAGQAVTNWLRDELGDGTVSPNLVTSHREILNRSIEYPIVSGHLFFEDGEGLEPRFQYATILREPVDRTISWLFFVTRNHQREDLPQLYDECEAFLASEGKELSPYLAEAIANPMVVHYAQILGAKGLSESELVESAYRAIKSYDCVGTYEKLSEFVGDLGRLIGVPAPRSLQSTNMTRHRPTPKSISDKLRDNILAITELDRDLYARVAKLVSDRSEFRPDGPTVSRWARYDRPAPNLQTVSSFNVLSPVELQEIQVCRGEPLKLEIEFEVREPIAMLQAGVLMFDNRKQVAFGVNNCLLDQPFPEVTPGRYRLIHSIEVDLPVGEYMVGFQFSDLRESGQLHLYRNQAALMLNVRRGTEAIGVGYAVSPATMSLDRTSNSRDAAPGDPPEDPGHDQIAA